MNLFRLTLKRTLLAPAALGMLLALGACEDDDGDSAIDAARPVDSAPAGDTAADKAPDTTPVDAGAVDTAPDATADASAD